MHCCKKYKFRTGGSHLALKMREPLELLKILSIKFGQIFTCAFFAGEKIE
jgi:hypothetical protein